MKLIISENQYRRLLERKNQNLLNEYQNVNFIGGIKKISPEISTILGYLSTLSDSDTDVQIINGNEIDVITDKEGIKDSLKDFLGSNQEEYKIEDKKGKLNIKYEKKTLPIINTDDEDYEIEDATYDVDGIINDVRYKVPDNTNAENLDTVVRDLIKQENSEFFKKVKNNDSFIRYCFPHFHKGIDVGSNSELDKKIVFKKPFTVTNIGDMCFVLKDDENKYHRFCHCQNVTKYITKDKKYPKGSVIGEVGNEGYSTAPHVHYEIGKGVNGNKLTGHKDPKSEWKTYWGVMDGNFYKKNGKKYWKRIDLEPSSTGFGKREPIESLCDRVKTKINY